MTLVIRSSNLTGGRLFQTDREDLKPAEMGTIQLRVALGLLLVALLGQARSLPAIREPGSALARPERAFTAKPPVIEDIYDYEKSYRDDPSYYPNEDDYDDYLDYYDSSEDTTKEEVDDEKEDDEEANSKEKRQYKGGLIQNQNGEIGYDVDGAGSDPWRPVINELDDEIRSGVVPLPPIQAPDVSKGVEAVGDEGDEDDGSFSDWVGDRWGDFVSGLGKVGDHIDDTFDTIGDRIHGAAHSAGSSIIEAYHSFKNKLSELRVKIHRLFSSFGLMVQRGADYCIQRLQHTANQVREAQLLDKLHKKLKEGNEQVTAFFTILGEKFTSWARSQGQEDVDEGLILVDGSFGPGGTHGDHTEDEDGNREQVFPNLFQDQEVLEQMNKMVSQGVITQEELNLLYQQTEQGVKPPQQDPAIHVDSHTRRRNLRSRIVVL